MFLGFSTKGNYAKQKEECQALKLCIDSSAGRKETALILEGSEVGLPCDIEDDFPSFPPN